ncbi:MAG TPA: EF-hand domain-containing protein [Albitalea sp.]|uniref:EF-hand domain-containing protein n=1 Tax=Piscinibacter sp. TaxID=1903157 RepID=UPI002ED2520B
MSRSVRKQLLSAILLTGVALVAAAQSYKQPDKQPAPVADASTDAAALQAAFDNADINRDGRLTRQEAARIPAVHSRFDQLDKDRNGYLTPEEFGKATGQLSRD